MSLGPFDVRSPYLVAGLVLGLAAGLRLVEEVRAPPLAILCLHGIEDPDPMLAPWSLPRPRAEAVLDAVRRSGRLPVPLDAIDPAGPASPPGRPAVLLTFDDGRPGQAELAAELARRGIPAVFFLPSAPFRRPLDDAGARALVALGHGLGVHSRTHGELARRSHELPEAYAARLEVETVGARRELEAVAGRTLEAYSYPGGEHPEPAVEAVRAAGFRLAFTTEYGHATAGSDPLRLPRFMLTAATDPVLLDEYLDPGFRLWSGLLAAVLLVGAPSAAVLVRRALAARRRHP